VSSADALSATFANSQAAPDGPRTSGPEASRCVEQDRLLNAGEVAELLGVPERWVRDHTRSGLIPHVKLGRYTRYRRAAVLNWLDEQETSGASWRRHRPRAAARGHTE
jgi:excisionase family DNA binding protein